MKQPINGMIIQYFEWYLNCNKNLWNSVQKRGEEFLRLSDASTEYVCCIIIKIVQIWFGATQIKHCTAMIIIEPQ